MKEKENKKEKTNKTEKKKKRKETPTLRPKLSDI
jgi:hypothetical protein